MRVAILTTGSVRRRYFVRALAKSCPDVRVFVETGSVRPPFETAHALDEEARRHEAEIWFAGAPPDFEDIAEVARFESLNAPPAVAAIAAARPDVVLVFGTGRLSQDVLAIRPEACLNLHGGDPEEYRGLDCHLWTVYHGDFAALVSTLHRLEPELDTGDIVLRRPVPLRRGMALAELRRAHTEVCLALAEEALAGFAATGTFPARPQRRRGRYYSFMPAVLKDICVARFARHTARL